jgi:hypothetical protein
VSNVVFFDGVDDYVTCGVNIAAFKMGNLSFSICGRIKCFSTSPNDATCVFGVRTNVAVSRYALQINRSANNINMTVIDDLGNSATGLRNFNVTESKWHHYCLVVNRTTNLAKIYVDGFQLGADINIAAIVGTVNPDGNSYIGYGVFGTPISLNGLMAEVQVYAKALTDAEVRYNYEHPGNPVGQGNQSLRLNLTQESIRGAQWVDLTGGGNHGTYVGGAVPRRANLVTQR